MQSYMQSDVDINMTRDEADGDQDSLFGSPPSSPVIGRSRSPTLALPSASNTTQNVGTIALPGSHHCSELAVTPLALPPLSHATIKSSTQRIAPSAPSPIQDTRISPPSSGLSKSRASSESFLPKHNKRKGKSKEPSFRPLPPEIPLPDPSGPVPANFLRNQSALLGTAGLVGGVKPAHLSVPRRTRGTSPSNPIVVEDEQETLKSGRGPMFSHSYFGVADPVSSPAPSTQDVVSVLIGQKDIFPVLESLLKLIAGGSGSQSASSFQSQSVAPPSGPPTKKRRLTRVPAGAADWDVPYPFPPGQGPESYRTTWERERGKQLMSQLTGLIKSAARKATARLSHQNGQAKSPFPDPGRPTPTQLPTSSSSSNTNNRAEPKVLGHYRLSTTTYGAPSESVATGNSRLNHVLNNTNGSLKNPLAQLPSSDQLVNAKTASTTTSAAVPPANLDQLVASLLAATHTQDIPPNPQNSNHPTTANSSHLSSIGDAHETASGLDAGAVENSQNVDQGVMDSWMNILQTFPMSAEAFSQAYATQLEPGLGLSSLPGNEEVNFFDFDPNRIHPTHADLSSLNPENTADLGTISWPSTQTGVIDMEATFPTASLDLSIDSAIDPTLLAISLSQSNPLAAASVLENLPSLTPSPMPSLGSSGDTGPATPTSALWDFGAVEVYQSSGGDTVMSDGGMPIGLNCQSGGQSAGQGDVNVLEGFVGTYGLDHGHAQVHGVSGIDKGKGRDMTGNIDTSLSLRATTSPMEATSAARPNQIVQPTHPPALPNPASDVALSGKPVYKVNKAEILQRAEERRKQLVMELNSVKTQLWETTIEQGILSHINKHSRNTS